MFSGFAEFTGAIGNFADSASQVLPAPHAEKLSFP
jgi:hypothetical protein